MNLVHVLPYYAPAWAFGGVVRAAYDLTTTLAARGHTVTVVTTDAGVEVIGSPQTEMLDGVRVVRCPNRLPALRRVNLSSPSGLRAGLRPLLAGADIVHVHEFRTVENLITLSLARAGGVPVVMSPHGTLGYGAGRSLVKRAWDVLLGRWSASRIDMVAALTQDEVAETRRLWAQFGLDLPERGWAVVPNGVNPTEFEALPPRSVFRQRWGIPADVPLLLFMGRLHRRKGAHHLIDALADLPAGWLAVVGPDEGELRALQDQAHRRGVTDRVVFTGLLTGADKLAAFAGADVLALPAVGEGLPMVVLEAMAAGLPVAVSDECHLPEVVDAGAGVRLAVLECAAVAAALRPVLADAELRQQMGRAAQALVHTTFTWSAAAARMTAVYERLVSAQRGK